MKVETVLMIDGSQVEKVFEKGDILVYQHNLDNHMTGVILFFVNNKTQEVMFKQEILADCGQNTRYIDRIDFTGVNEWKLRLKNTLVSYQAI